MAATADQLKHEIAQRRDEIGRDLDALGEKVSPGRVVHRRAARIGGRFHRMREAVMGTAEDTGGRVATTASDATDRISSAASDAADSVRQMPETAREKVEGNPLAAGLIAYGFGMLVASVVPPTRTEQELAKQARPLVDSAMDEAKNVGQEVVADLREPARDAVEQVKETAAEAAQNVKQTTTEAVEQTASGVAASPAQPQRPTPF
jgi:ElaB/YqjD/DUF883 family membrane-anchored ribosome-binding protein